MKSHYQTRTKYEGQEQERIAPKGTKYQAFADFANSVSHPKVLSIEVTEQQEIEIRGEPCLYVSKLVSFTRSGPQEFAPHNGKESFHPWWERVI